MKVEWRVAPTAPGARGWPLCIRSSSLCETSRSGHYREGKTSTTRTLQPFEASVSALRLSGAGLEFLKDMQGNAGEKNRGAGFLSPGAFDGFAGATYRMTVDRCVTSPCRAVRRIDRRGRPSTPWRWRTAPGVTPQWRWHGCRWRCHETTGATCRMSL